MPRNNLTVLLIHPEISRTKYNFVGVIENECLELEYISALLKQHGHTVYMYDGQIETGGVPKALKAYNPDIVYVCGRPRQENFMLEYCDDAKAFRSDIITIIGGLHAQLCYERMYTPSVDYILTSFNIFALLDIIEHEYASKDVSLIPDICYRQNGEWIKNPSKPFDINLLPLPDRSYFNAYPNRYRYLELEHAAWVRTAYCCPYHCKFCIRNRMNCGVYSARRIEDVVDEIAAIESENIYIVDDDFLFDEHRLETFVELIRAKDIHKKYICYGRSDFIATHEELMKELASIGLYYVLVGLEAIDDKHLNDYHKLSNVSNNQKSIALCNALGINIMGMFILDLDFQPKDFSALYKWIKAHDLKHVAVSIFTPEMGIETYEAYKDRLITDNPSHFDYLHVVATPSRMSVRRYYFHYYVLLIKLFLKAQRDGIYDFLDYGDYIKSFIGNIFRKKRSNDDE